MPRRPEGDPVAHAVASASPDALTPDAIPVRISAEQIQQRIAVMAQAINQTYHQTACERLVVIAILKGSFLFLADLARHLTMPCQIEFVRLASYGHRTHSSGVVKPVDLSLPDLDGADVLIVEDIMDTGLTLRFFMDYLRTLHQTRSLRLAVLLDKPQARSEQAHGLAIDFCGFTVQNEFLVGYGLDYAGLYRNLPFVGVLPTP